MPVIVNAYKSDNSLGDTLSSLGEHFFGGKDQLQGDLLRERVRGFRRNSDAIDQLQRQAATPGGVDYANPNARAAAYGLDRPSEAFDAQLGINANRYGAMDARTTNAATGAKVPYQSTGQGFTTAEANTMARAKMSAETAAHSAERMAANRPYAALDEKGDPITVSQMDAIRRGLRPVLTSGQVEGALRAKGFESGYADQNPQQHKAAGVQVPYGETETGFNTAQDNTMRRAEMTADKAAQAAQRAAEYKPVNTYNPDTNQPEVTRTSESFGRRPVLEQGVEKGILTNQNFNNLPGLSTGQRQVIGANPPVEHVLNWQLTSPDGATREGISHDGGLTDARTHEPVPTNARVWGPTSAGGANVIGAPTNTVSTHLQEKHANNRELLGHLDAAQKLIDANPYSVGGTGNLQKYGQQASIAGAQLASFMGKGKNWESAVANIKADAEQRYGASAPKLFSDIFDPSISQIDALYGILTYKTAQALFGQEGRGLNLEDVKQTRALLGNPGNWLQNPQELKTRLAVVRAAAQANVTTSENAIRQRNALQPPVAGAPATTGQLAPAAPGATEEWGRGPDGRPVRLR